jgi:hypothetical protein
MGRCPKRIGINIPHIQGFQSIIYVEQDRNENGFQRELSHRNYALRECGMDFNVFTFFRMMKRIPSCTDGLVPSYS